jgi:HD superfamily phosphodiesterase
MLNIKCPGTKKLRDKEPDIIICPGCKTELEIWSDEVQIFCAKCKKDIIRTDNQSCVDWCSFAKDCIGISLYNKYQKNKDITLKHKLLLFLEGYFGKDVKRIEHAKNVLMYSEKILKEERGNWHIVVPASILHDIGIKTSEEKYGSSSSHYQEIEGPPIAHDVLVKLGFKKKDIDEICDIIGNHHSPGKIKTNNFYILNDSDWLVNINEEADKKDKEKLRRLIDKYFLTKKGKEIAENLYINNNEEIK